MKKCTCYSFRDDKDVLHLIQCDKCGGRTATHTQPKEKKTLGYISKKYGISFDEADDMLVSDFLKKKGYKSLSKLLDMTTQPKEKKQDWEKELRKKFCVTKNNHPHVDEAYDFEVLEADPEDIKQLIRQAILSAEERAREGLKASVELWMATHDKLDKSFTTDELLKFIFKK